MARIPRMLLGSVAVAAAAAGLVACGGGSESSNLPQGVVAQVGDSQITQAEFDRAFEQARASSTSQGTPFPAKGTAEYDSARQQVLQQLVQQRIVDFEAAKCGPRCRVTPKEIQAQLDMLKKTQFGNSDAKFSKFLVSRKLSLPDARRILRASLEQPKLIAYVTRGVRFTTADAKKYYEQNPSQFKVAEQRDASHILVKNKALAERIRAEATPQNFAALARKYSTDPGSKAQGGELGAIQKGQVVPEFEKVVFAAKNGEISQPFKTQFGWHIVYVRIKPGSTKTFAQAKSQIISSQLSTKRQAEYAQWSQRVLATYEKRTKYADASLKPPATTAPAAAPAATTPTTSTP